MLKQVVGGAGLVSSVDHGDVLVRDSSRNSRVRPENFWVAPVRDLAGHDLRQGALLQLDAGNFVVEFLAGVSVLIATINIVGGFMVTRRMLSMFQKS